MRKSKRSKATDIPLSVRERVYERSGGKCETCHTWCNDKAFSNSHFVPRSQGGLGIEENILHQCIDCHRKMDFGTREEKQKVKTIAKNYLKRKYDKWNEEELKYKKGVT